MKQLLDDTNHECLVCKVPAGCEPGHKLCGISIGIKYEIYPADAHRRPARGNYQIIDELLKRK